MPTIRALVLGACCALLVVAAPASAAGPYGATPMDTSAYALGRVRLNVIFMESNGQIDANQENWTAAQLSNVHREIGETVDFWESLTAGYHPNARLKFDVNYANGGVPIETPYEPINRPSFDDSNWINGAMNQLGYNSFDHFENVRAFDHDQRTANGDDWALTVFVVNDEFDADNRFSNSQFAYSYIGGPYVVTTYGNDGWGIDRYNRVLSHEMAHSFFALDEYTGGGARNNEFSGYLNGINGNSELNGQGQVVVPPQPQALMLNNTLDTSPFTDVQLGHRDTDGDTIPDILDTFPLLTGNALGSDPLAGMFAFAGSAVVTTIPNENTNQIGFSSSGADMTINWIAGTEYRVNGGAWSPVLGALDGLFDEGLESLAFSLPTLIAGGYDIDVRALNSVDNPSNELHFHFESQAAVPEPSTLALASIGAIGLLASVRRRRTPARDSL
jgi:hypothetical protein